MIRLHNIYYNDILNIFCDASITFKNKICFGCYGAIAVSENNIIDKHYQVCSNTTNNNSEIKAIRSAVLLALRYRYKYPIINIFSDSQISLFGIRDRCYLWKAKENELYGYQDNEPIKNQSVFIEIMNLISDNQLYIFFYHQKGHVNIKDKNSLQIANHVFLASNKIRDSIDQEFIKYISYYNSIVDNESRTILKNTNLFSLPYVQPVKFVPVDYYRLSDTYNKIIKGENKI